MLRDHEYDLDAAEVYGEPRVEESVKVRCMNPECIAWGDPDYYWNPKIETEYCGVSPHGGPVDFYSLDAFECPECGEEGQED